MAAFHASGQVLYGDSLLDESKFQFAAKHDVQVVRHLIGLYPDM